MGDTDAAVADVAKREEEQQKTGIPGLDWSFEEKNEFERKVSFSPNYTCAIITFIRVRLTPTVFGHK